MDLHSERAIIWIFGVASQGYSTPGGGQSVWIPFERR